MRAIELSATDVADVHRFVARRVSNHADAADIAQQALLRACTGLKTCRGGSLSAWLFAIARHSIADHYRARNGHHFVEVTALADTEPALRTRPDAVVTTCECRERLSRWTGLVRRCLYPEEQVAVLLADIYGHWASESAQLLRMSVPSFKLLLHRARRHLREAEPCSECPSRRLGVTCPLARSRLLALRDELLEGLSL